MALDWIKMRTDLPRDPRVQAITVAVGWDDVDFTIGKLHAVWRYFDEQSLDGVIRHLTPALLNRIIKVEGFAEAMAAVDWLEVRPNELAVPRIDEHFSETAKRRATDARRKSIGRHRGANGHDLSADQGTGEQSVSERCPPTRGQAADGKRTDRGSEVDDTGTGHGRAADDTRPTRGRLGDLDESESEREKKNSPVNSEGTSKSTRRASSDRQKLSLSREKFESLFTRILEVTRERDTERLRALYRHYAERMGVDVVGKAISQTKQRATRQVLREPGRYFNGTCQKIAQELGIDLGRNAA